MIPASVPSRFADSRRGDPSPGDSFLVDVNLFRRNQLGTALLVAGAAALLMLGLRVPALAQAQSTEYELTESDSGREIRVQVGDTVRVTLGAPGDDRWTAPTASSSERVGVFRFRLSVDADGTFALFRAGSASRNLISSEVDYACRHFAQPCPSPSRTFSATIVVDPAPTPTVTPTHIDCPTPTSSPPPITGPVPDAVEVTDTNEGTPISLSVGQYLSVRIETVGNTVRLPTTGLVIDRWYVEREPDNGCPNFSRTRTQVIVRAVAAAVGTVDVVDDYECFYTFQCAPPNRTWSYPIGIGPSGSDVASVETSLSHMTITAGNAPTVTAALRTADGAPAHGYVTLFARAYGEGSYRSIGTAYSDSGEARFVVRPSVQTAYVAAVTNVSGRHASIADVIQVHARVNVDHPPANGGHDGPTVPFTGTLVPPRSAVPVGVGVMTQAGVRYLGQANTDANGRFLVRVTGLTFGWHIFVVYTSARAGTLRGSTRVRAHIGCC